ncbi:acyl-CoA dehydrogenase family protein [Oceanicola sp. 22II-s10i]|uniref:acyl-CoA dehydrogenase family protein n=1 Tax=Oceanicola sp. 22II-s10i TaxID=1317116 RepID=UPI001595B9E4|nr:acyl-CoA dehydrogenase family protein [Oceanicola sp. 22II-s10i]
MSDRNQGETDEARAEDLLRQAQDFADQVIAPRAAEWDRTNTYDIDTLREASRFGWMGLQVPRDQGGLGLPFSVKSRLSEVLAGADFGFSLSLINSTNIGYKLCRDAPHLAERYLSDLISARRLGSTALTEPGAGTDFAAISTTATRDGDGWRLNGTKAWIINAAASDLIILYAQTEPGSRGAGIAAFLIDGQREGFSRLDRFELSGQHSIGVGGFELKNYHARDDEMMQAPGQAFKYALTDINGARTYVGAMCCGMVAAALKIAAEYGRRRETFGRRLVEHQGWRWSLGEADMDLAAARALVRHAEARIDAGLEARFESARAKLFATRMAERHLPALAQLMGAEGLSAKYPFGRHIQGAKISGFVDGSSEILLDGLSMQYAKG